MINSEGPATLFQMLGRILVQIKYLCIGEEFSSHLSKIAVNPVVGE